MVNVVNTSIGPTNGDGYMMLGFTLNYIFGVGVLAIPYAFINGGILASVILLLVSSFFSLLNSQFLFAVQSRAQRIPIRKDIQEYKKQLSAITGNVYNGTMGRPLNIVANSPVFETFELCEMYVGSRFKLAYNVALTVFIVSSAWIYMSIFALSAMQIKVFSSKNITCELSSVSGFLAFTEHKSCYFDYLFYLSVFAVLQIFILWLGLSKLKHIQRIFTGIGFFALFLMIIWSICILFRNGVQKLKLGTIVLDFSGIGTAFNVLVFSQLCSIGTPGLLKLDKTNGKLLLYATLKKAIFLTTVSYLVLGFICSLTFGYQTRKVISINWHEMSFSSYDPKDFDLKFQSFFTVFFNSVKLLLAYFIGLYPCVTCSAAFPLYVITLGDNWAEHFKRVQEEKANNTQAPETPIHFSPILKFSVTERGVREFGLKPTNELTEPLIPIVINFDDSDSEDSVQSLKLKQKKVKDTPDFKRFARKFHYFSALLPLFLAALIADVKLIFFFSGLSAFFTSLVVPAVLQLKSREAGVRDVGSDLETTYDSRFSTDKWAKISLVFAAVAALFSTAALFF